MSDDVERFEREEHLPAPIEDVWESLTEPAGLGAWLAGEVDADPRPGGELTVLTEGEKRTGFFEEVDDEAHRVAFWWRRPEEDATRVEIELDEDPAGTRIRVVESRPLGALDAGGTLIETWAAGALGPQMSARAALVA